MFRLFVSFSKIPSKALSLTSLYYLHGENGSYMGVNLSEVLYKAPKKVILPARQSRAKAK